MTGSTLDDLPVVRDAFRRTVRLVSSARLRDPVLAALVAEEELSALAEIEGATSARLRAEAYGAEDVASDELVHGVPYAAFINASFAYWKPRQPNRFNASRGTWYAALSVETCMREVAYHMAEFLADSGTWQGVVDYAEMFASMAGEFFDLREKPKHAALDPDPAIGYPVGNAVADVARAHGLNGVIYPSVRHDGGTCIAAIRPNAVQSVAPGGLYRFTWSGTPQPAITSLAG